MATAKKFSRKREAILTCLHGTTCHPTAEWVYQQLKPQFPDLSLGTVYRNLAAFKAEGVIDSVGVVNGLDVAGYDPAHDPALPENYDVDHMAGKAACKASLQASLGLAQEPDTPLMGIVSRLVGHKGLDIVEQGLDGIMATGCQLVVLGQGESQFEDAFRWAQNRWPGRVSAQITYSDNLSRRIYGAADLFLMPSRSEPCGLSQMIAMRYGTVPIVRETGGLKDTVQPYEAWRDAGTGFTFANYSSADMLHVLREAAYLYKDYPDAFARLRRRAMERDFSWNRSAGDYLKIYAAVTGAAAAASESDDTEALKAEVPTAAAEPAKKRTSARKAVSGKAAKPVKAASAKKAVPAAPDDGARVPKTAEKSTKTRKTAEPAAKKAASASKPKKKGAARKAAE